MSVQDFAARYAVHATEKQSQRVENPAKRVTPEHKRGPLLGDTGTPIPAHQADAAAYYSESVFVVVVIPHSGAARRSSYFSFGAAQRRANRARILGHRAVILLASLTPWTIVDEESIDG